MFDFHTFVDAFWKHFHAIGLWSWRTVAKGIWPEDCLPNYHKYLMSKYVLFCLLLLKIVQQSPSNLNVPFMMLQAHISFQQLFTFQSGISVLFFTLRRKSTMNSSIVKDVHAPLPSFPEEGSPQAALPWEMGQVTVSFSTGHLSVYMYRLGRQKERCFQKTSADKSLCPGTIPIEAECLQTLLFWRLA